MDEIYEAADAEIERHEASRVDWNEVDALDELVAAGAYDDVAESTPRYDPAADAAATAERVAAGDRVCTSDDPRQHDGDTCPIHEEIHRPDTPLRTRDHATFIEAIRDLAVAHDLGLWADLLIVYPADEPPVFTVRYWEAAVTTVDEPLQVDPGTGEIR